MEEHMKLFPLQGQAPVRIVIPADVAADIGKVHTVVDNLARRLGCEGCFSGSSCVLIQQHEFIVRPENLEVEGLPTIREGF